MERKLVGEVMAHRATLGITDRRPLLGEAEPVVICPRASVHAYLGRAEPTDAEIALPSNQSRRFSSVESSTCSTTVRCCAWLGTKRRRSFQSSAYSRSASTASYSCVERVTVPVHRHPGENHCPAATFSEHFSV